MKIFYPIQVIDFRFQIDQIMPKNIQKFEENGAAANTARIIVFILKHSQIKKISEGQKFKQVIVI